MPIPKLKQSEKATHHIIVRKDQHRTILAMAKRKRMSTTYLIDAMINALEEKELTINK
jgi:hypothetical protein